MAAFTGCQGELRHNHGPSYYRARYYDASTGRFLSEDPIGFDGGIDFYSYVENEPTGLIDPSGSDSYGWPVPGSATPHPKPGDPPLRRNPYNCMAHGLGRHDRWMQPNPPPFPNPTDLGLYAFMRQNGCKEVNCDSVEACGKRHRVNTYQSLDSRRWHVERQDCGTKFWSSKNGEGPLVIGISNPDDYYQKAYGPVLGVKKICWSCKGN